VRRIARACAAAIALAGAFAFPAWAQEVPLTAKIQVALFKKIFAYDKVIARPFSAKVLIVYAPGHRRDADALLREFSAAGLNPVAVLESEIHANSEGASALYVLPRAGHAALRDVSVPLKLLTISGAPSYAESGYVAVALAVRPDGRPEIVVNLARARAEGHDLSSDLLKLARIVPAP
jgi:hypothetical protein